MDVFQAAKVLNQNGFLPKDTPHQEEYKTLLDNYQDHPLYPALYHKPSGRLHIKPYVGLEATCIYYPYTARQSYSPYKVFQLWSSTKIGVRSPNNQYANWLVLDEQGRWVNPDPYSESFFVLGISQSTYPLDKHKTLKELTP